MGATFTSTQQRALALLFGQPNRSFFVTELMSLANSGGGAVRRELGRLAHSGLVTVTKVGNQKHYQTNHKSPIFEELCGIFKKTVGLQEPVRAAVEPLANQISLALSIATSLAARKPCELSTEAQLPSSALSLSGLHAVRACVSAPFAQKRVSRRRALQPAATEVLVATGELKTATSAS